MTDEEIALTSWLKSAASGWLTLPWQNADQIFAALAAARLDQHKECVRLLRERAQGEADKVDHYAWMEAAEWLEQHQPKG